MKELMKEIGDYWSTRTEGYSEVNEKELLGTQKEAWLTLLKNEFPQKARENLRILDIGTGPGFFPVILAGEGYYVDAVDYTEGMLEKAKENVEKYLGKKKDHVIFYRMDAQALDFQDNTFDVVITRNLTWNLPDPVKAYQEWIRVLRPGGKLLNFDANWYGYLYDEEKRQAYEKDRENVEKESLDDHYLCTDIDRMEEIARQVPLSGKLRPAWDEKVLTDLGVSVKTDTQVWERVWSTEEKLNYGSTPIFMVQAVKKESWGSYTLGDMTIQPGQREQGFLSLGDGEFSLPVAVIRGEKPGKTVLITAGIHPGEYVGIQSAVELAEDLKAEKMSGTVILVKAVSREDFEARKDEIVKNLQVVMGEILCQENMSISYIGEKESVEMVKAQFVSLKKLMGHVADTQPKQQITCTKKNEGFTFKRYDGTECLPVLHDLFDITRDAFLGTELYSDIPYEYFEKLYAAKILKIEGLVIFVAYDQNQKAIGYVLGYPNPDKSIFVAKSSAVMKEYQNNKVYIALLYLGLKYMEDLGYSETLFHFQCEQRKTFRRFPAEYESKEKHYAVFKKEL